MWQMFLFFLQLGFLSFGGGYALIPMIEAETAARGWMSGEAFYEAAAVAGMSPGPIAVNLGTIVGYQTYGFGGAAAALAGLTLPSMLVAAAIALLVYRLRKQVWIERLLYGLQPVVVALIIFAAYRLAAGALGHSADFNGQLLFGILLVPVCWMMLVRYRMHPIYILVFSAISGAAFLA